MSKPDESGNGHGGAVAAIKCPTITIVFDPRTYTVEVQGNTPTLLFAKAMLQMAADELERQIVEQRTVKRVSLATADILGSLPKVQG
jgi:hypothetical protein